jgi:uncharacterized protein (TIGR01777 family)
MRVLVTGASGMIGSALCNALLARGDEVVGLSRDPERARATNPTTRWFAWQATMERPPAGAFEGVDGVINLIGERIFQRWTEAAKARIMESRRTATRNLVDAIAGLESRPSVLLSQSAVGYYGDHGEAIVDESTPPGDRFDSEVTVEWESAAQEVDGLGTRLVITRTGIVLDPAGGMLAQTLRPFRLGLGGPIGTGRQYMPWIHRDDEIAILLWALDNARVAGAVNATAPNPVTNREFSKALGRVLGRPAVMRVPTFALRTIFGPELTEVATDSQRVVPRRALDLGFDFRFPELEQALRDLLRG